MSYVKRLLQYWEEEVPTYTYKARDEGGKAVTGVLEAPSREAVASKLHQMGYMVSRVEEGLPPGVRLGAFREQFRGIKTEDMVLFNFQLSNMLNSGLTLLLSLETLKDQIENRRLKKIIAEVARNVEAGNSFSEALAMHPNIFPRLFVHMVRAGEATGHLDTVLSRYAVYAESVEDLRQKVRGALFYPAILLVSATAVILLVVTFVVPQFVEIFSKAGIPLPLPTQILHAVGLGIKRYWYLFLLAMGGLFAAFRWFRGTSNGGLVIDRWSLQIPVIGVLLRKVCISRSARTLTTLVSSGVPMLNALEIVEEVVGNRLISGAVRKARDSVEGGSKLAEPLKISGEFPLDTVQMISVGEESGNLDEMLNKISDFYDRGVAYSVKKLTTLIEPVCLVVMGVIVAFIMASMLLPIFDMAKTLRR